MGFWTWLNPLNWFRRRAAPEEVPAAAPTTTSETTVVATPTVAKTAAPATKKAAPKAAPKAATKAAAAPAAKKAAAKAPAKPATKAAAAPAKKAAATAKATAQCAALTAAGGQCKRTARDTSKYCASHKGYRPPAKAAKKTDTKPVGSKVKDTLPSTRRSHVTHNGYKLYQKGNRFYFSKKSHAEAKAGGADPVYEMPMGREVVVTPNGLPVLKTK